MKPGFEAPDHARATSPAPFAGEREFMKAMLSCILASVTKPFSISNASIVRTHGERARGAPGTCLVVVIVAHRGPPGFSQCS